MAGSLEEALAAAGRLHKLGSWAESKEKLRPLLEAAPFRAAALKLLIANEEGLGRLAEARTALKELLEIDPKDFVAWFKLGNIEAGLDLHTDAVISYQRVAALSKAPEAMFNMANSLMALGRVEEAVAAFKSALAARPQWSECLSNLSNALLELGRHAEARQCLGQALKLRGTDPQIRRNLANLMLFDGLSQPALSLYESRMALEPFNQMPHYKLPLLGERAPEGKRILVQWEQAFGDVIQVLRFAPLLEQRAQICVWELLAPLHAIAKRSFPAVNFVQYGEIPDRAFDARVPYTSLPLALRLFGDCQVPAAPYLKANLQKVEAWKAKAPANAAFVGLAWRGRESPRYRSVPIEMLEPLIRTGLPFLALQKDITPEEKQFLAPFANVTDASEGLKNFDDTAAAISSTRLMISIDTAVAHLAGALGHPCWVMLKKASDWRWKASGPKTIWYPSMHLFRQQTFRDWTDVVEKVRLALSSAVR